MDDKKKQRTNLRSKVTKKHGDAVLNLLDRNETTKAEIIKLIKDLSEVETELLEVDFDEKTFESYNCKCQVLVNYFSETTTTTTASNMERTIKYQRRALPTFDGDIIQFNLFFREFMRIVDGDSTLRMDEKFFALKSMLKGEPLRLVGNLLENGVNYELAKNILKERYQDKQRISNIIIDRIKMLPVINVNDLDGMQRTVDEMGCLYREAIDHGMDSYVIEEVIRPTILSKWYSPEAARHGSTCSGLIDFFVQDVKVYIRNRDLITTNQVNQVSTRPNCIFCRQNHKSIYCNADMTNKDRKDIAMKKKLCFICLQSNHQSGQCKSSYSCKKCGKRHSLVICTDNATRSAENVVAQTIPKNVLGDPTA